MTFTAYANMSDASAVDVTASSSWEAADNRLAQNVSPGVYRAGGFSGRAGYAYIVATYQHIQAGMQVRVRYFPSAILGNVTGSWEGLAFDVTSGRQRRIYWDLVDNGGTVEGFWANSDGANNSDVFWGGISGNVSNRTSLAAKLEIRLNQPDPPAYCTPYSTAVGHTMVVGEMIAGEFAPADGCLRTTSATSTKPKGLSGRSLHAASERLRFELAGLTLATEVSEGARCGAEARRRSRGVHGLCEPAAQ